MTNDHEHHDGEPDKTLVTFTPGDASNPRNFSERRKWAIVAAISLIDLSVSWGASGYSPASSKFVSEFHVSSEVGVLGLSLYVFGLAIGPMIMAPLSEYYGRTPLYIIPYGIYLVFLAGTALVHNLGGFLALRLLSGTFSGVTIANFGGTIADLWPRDQVGPAMSVFLWAAVCGSPTGYFLMSFVAERGWRDVMWALLGICGCFWLILCVTLLAFPNETRHSVLLRRRADRLNKEHDTSSYHVPADMGLKTPAQLFQITLVRPFQFLALEAIVQFAAAFNGYLYGLSFLFNDAFNLVFGEEGYGFSTVGVGTCFLGLALGITIGPVVNIWQERYYQKRVRAVAKASSEQDNVPTESKEAEQFRNVPEARVQLGKVAVILLPISLFWFAWTTPPQYNIHWIVPILATVLFGWSFFTLIMMAYLYTEDSYMVFSASALAGIGLSRNTFGAVFPLFGATMFKSLGYNWAGSVLAFATLLLMPIPFILEDYGKKLRAKSPYARKLWMMTAKKRVASFTERSKSSDSLASVEFVLVDVFE